MLFLKKLNFAFFFALFGCSFFLGAQQGNFNRDLQYFFSDHYGQLDSTFTSIKNSSTTFLIDNEHDSLANEFKNSSVTKWYQKLLLNDNSLTFKGKDYKLTFDPYYNFVVGKETVTGDNLWTNKRGIIFNAALGNKVKIHSTISEGTFAPDPFTAQYINNTRIVPGEGETKFTDNYFNNSNSSGTIEIDVNSFFDVTLGHGKNFLGEGYRSLFLSDAARSYPFLKLDLSVEKRVKYTAIIAEFIHYTPDMPGLGDVVRQKKYGTFHYLDIKVSKKLFLGLFESVMWGGDSSSRSSFDVNYLNPFVVMRPIELGLGSPDNMHLGSHFKYIPTKSTTFYGQFLLTEFFAKEFFGGNNWFGNKYAFKLGSKFHNFPFAKNLFIQLEYNHVRPFTYNHRHPITTFAHAGQSLAHPSGSNLQELIAIANYRHNKWSFNFKTVYRKSGLENSDSTSIGTDVLRSYELRESDFGNVTGQGISYQQFHTVIKTSYLINPSNMMFLEMGIENRFQIIDGTDKQSNFFFIGLRTGISNFYYDF